MVSPTRPNSTTGQTPLKKRASEVPPPVEGDGKMPATVPIACDRPSMSGPDWVRKDSLAAHDLEFDPRLAGGLGGRRVDLGPEMGLERFRASSCR